MNEDFETTAADAAEPVQPDPEPVVSDPAPVVEVISTEEFLETMRDAFMAVFVASEDAETIEEGEPEEEEPSLADQFFASSLEDTSSSDTVQLLTEIRDAVETHPLLSTDFADYTVVEGLLLALLLCVIGSWCVKMLKGGFSWLLS